MNNESPDPNRPVSDRKISDRALVLLLVGCLLLTPPLAGIFQLALCFTGIHKHSRETKQQKHANGHRNHQFNQINATLMETCRYSMWLYRHH